MAGIEKKERLKALVQYYANGSDKAFAEMIGITPQGLSSWKSRNTFDIELLYSKCVEVSPDWLLSGEGDMLRPSGNDDIPVKVEHKFPLRTDHNVEQQVVPLYSLEATAGIVPLYDDVEIEAEGHIMLPNLPPVDGAVYVRGDSMYPLIKSGDIVLYKAIKDIRNNIFWGELYIVAAFVDGEILNMVKYIQKSDKEDCIRLVSYNSHHSDIDLPLSCVQGVAIIKASVRYYTMG